MYSINEKALCFLCYKQSLQKPKNNDGIHSDIEPGGGGDVDNSYKLTSNFARNFSRYLNMGLTSEDQKVLAEFMSTCDPCSNLINEFCNLYNTLEILQLQLKAKAERIYETIRYNGREEDEDGIQLLDQIDAIRKKFIKNYEIRKMKCSQPKVYLERIQNSELPMPMETMMDKQEVINVELEDKTDITVENELINKCEGVQNEFEIMTTSSSSTAEPHPISELTFTVVENNSSSSKKKRVRSRRPCPTTLRIPRKLICKICLDEFTHTIFLRRHMKDAHDINQQTIPLECSYCSKDFIGGQLFQRFRLHMRKDHKLASGIPGDFKCEVCTENFETKISLKKHVIQLHNPNQQNKFANRYKSYFKRNFHLANPWGSEHNEMKMERGCQLCGKICRSVKSLQKHLKKSCIYRNKEQKLELTQENIPTEVANQSHEDSENEEGAEEEVEVSFNELFIKCDVRVEPEIQLPSASPTSEPEQSSQLLLPPTLSTSPTSSPHLKRPKPRIPTCKKCGCRFNHPFDLRQHMKNKHHQDQRIVPLECCHCEKSFRGRDTTKRFRRHMNTVHKIGSGLPGEFECEVCQEKFQRQNEHRRHMEWAHNPNLMCEICQKMFETGEKLESHKNHWHSNKEERSCHLCGIICNSLLTLEKHLKMECSNRPKTSLELEENSDEDKLEDLSHNDDDEEVEFVLPDILPGSPLPFSQHGNAEEAHGLETDYDFVIKIGTTTTTDNAPEFRNEMKLLCVKCLITSCSYLSFTDPSLL
ncbi:unnamed protein product [Orchesella dallaii]|uniref:C2H2-type domain-containing protein n=1 Tax=Orchesella dallaii TaxID=48710 RepID=A0ABP1PU16_9HEXA